MNIRSLTRGDGVVIGAAVLLGFVLCFSAFGTGWRMLREMGCAPSPSRVRCRENVVQIFGNGWLSRRMYLRKDSLGTSGAKPSYRI